MGAILSLLPDNSFFSGRLLSTWGVSMILTARSTAKELLFTMMSRGSKAQRQLISSRHHAYITGFGIAAAMLLSVPIVGPLFWFDMVQLGAHVLMKIVAADADSAFDLSFAVEQFQAEEARKKEEMEKRSSEREARALQRREERERKLIAKIKSATDNHCKR